MVKIALHMDFKHVRGNGLLYSSPNHVKPPQIKWILLLRNVVLQTPDLRKFLLDLFVCRRLDDLRLPIFLEFRDYVHCKGAFQFAKTQACLEPQDLRTDLCRFPSVRWKAIINVDFKPQRPKHIAALYFFRPKRFGLAKFCLDSSVADYARN